MMEIFEIKYFLIMKTCPVTLRQHVNVIQNQNKTINTDCLKKLTHPFGCARCCTKTFYYENVVKITYFLNNKK